MTINNEVDLPRKRFVVNIVSNIFQGYFPHFEGLIKKRKSKLPPGTECVQISPDTVQVSFPISIDSAENIDDPRNGDIRKIGISVPAEKVEAVMKFVSAFLNRVVMDMCKHREFLPLTGYPEKSLVEDVKEALSNKRDLIIIDTYQAYLDSKLKAKSAQEDEETKIRFNQVHLKYKEDKSEYCDVVCMLTSGNFKEWRKTYTPKLVSTDWI